MDFDKPHRSFDEQVQILKNRGLIVQNEALAVQYLSNINYYRLGTYWWTFEADHINHRFKENITFEQVLNLYVFDRELRLIVLDAIERIEIALRTQWAYHLSKHDGSHAHLNSHNFKKKFKHQDFVKSIHEELNRNNDPNIMRQNQKYDEETPAIWIVCEVLSFGQLSKSYKGISKRWIKNNIANHFGLSETTFSSLLHHLVVVRNACAHHSRLWNRDFTFTLKIPKHVDAKLRDSLNLIRDRKLYNTLVLLSFIMDMICPEHQWTHRLVSLFKKYPDIPVEDMGFPENWKSLPQWSI